MKRRIIRIGAVALSTSLVVGLVISGVGAAPGDGFNCRGCVDKDDIGRAAVGSAETKDGTIKAHDLHPNARTAAGEVALGDAWTTSTSPDQLWAIRIAAPARGFVQVTVTGDVLVDADAADNANEVGRGDLGLCSVSASLSDADCGHVQTYWFPDEPGDLGTPENFQSSFAATRVIPVTKGKNTVYLNAKTYDTDETFQVWNVVASAIFARGGLGLTVAA